MEKLFFIVCSLLFANLIFASEISSNSDEKIILEKFSQVLHSIKSARCKADLNYTFESFANEKSWAIGSKEKIFLCEFTCMLCDLSCVVLRKL